MMKRIPYFLILLFLISCEDVYVAKLHEEEDLLVIEGHVTDNPLDSYVKISKTQPFYDEEIAEQISGAEVFLVDEEGNSFSAYQYSPGLYKFQEQPQYGIKYQLEVTIDGQEYESDYEVMPPPPITNMIDVKTDTTITYRYSSYGEAIPQQKVGNRLLFDLPVSDELSHYLAKTTTVLEYMVSKQGAPPPPPPFYGWITSSVRGSFNIAGPPEYGVVDVINNFSVSFTQNRLDGLLSAEFIAEESPSMTGWIVLVDFYGISDNTYELYKTLNAQLEAEGKLFDPVFPQIESNIHCVSDPEKVIVGYFELSSHRHLRFFVTASGGRDPYFYEVTERHNIPDRGYEQFDQPPEFWEYPSKNR